MKADIRISRAESNKRKYLPLLLLGDEQESLIAGYLDRGDLFVLEGAGEVCGVCVVTKENPGVYEIQNIAVAPKHQRRGFGRTLIEFVWKHYPDLNELCLGTGDSPSTIAFYQALGFVETGREKEYFLLRYDHPIYEDGKRLVDRILLKREKEPRG